MNLNKYLLVIMCILIIISSSVAFAQDSDNLTSVNDDEILIGQGSEIYISPSGTGSGESADSPTNWNNAYSKASNGDAIIFLNGTYTTLVNKNIAKSLELKGSGASIVDANNITGFFTIYASSTVTLNNLIIFNGETGYNDAGAIVNNGNLIVNRTYFSSSSGWGTEGGAIHNNGYCTIYDSVFFNNTAKKGGSIFVSKNGYLDVYNTTFIKGSSKSGNCINIDDGGRANIYNCSFVNCSAKSSIIYVDKKSSVNIINSSFTNSRAVADAAAIYTKKESNVYVENCRFVKCNAIENGGAIYSEGTMNIENSSFINCSAVIDGGAIYAASKGYITVSGSEFIGNTAANGRHIYSEGYSVSLSDCVLEAVNTIKTTNISSGEVENVGITIDEGTNFLSVNVNLVLNNKTVIGTVSQDYTYDLKDLADGEYSVSLTSSDNLNGNSYTYSNPYVKFSVGNITPVDNKTGGDNKTDSNITDDNKTGEDNKTIDDNKTELKTILNAPDIVKYYGGSQRFIVYLKDSQNKAIAGENVTIQINGLEYQKPTNSNGSASISLGLNSGEYTVLTSYNGINITSKVHILPTINGSDVVKIFKNATQYLAVFSDANGNLLTNTTVSFNINGIFYNRTTNNNGVARLNINLAQGTYVITAINLATGEMSTNNITVLSSIVENNDLVKYYKNSSQYAVKVLDSDGNPIANKTVTFNINGMLYNRTSNSNGIARLNINLQPGDYIITAEYNGCRVSNNITVLPVLFTDNMVKNYGTSKQFEAKLLDGNGKSLANTNVSFNINGILYNRQTNSEGIAKLNINLMSGSYIITSSYNGLNTANIITIY